MAELANRPDIPADVKKVLQDLELEESEDQPDEQQLEVLEDIWLKAGELDAKESGLYTEKNFRKKGRKRKKKPPGAVEKDRKEMKAKKLSAKAIEESSIASSSNIKTEYLDIISASVPCLVLPNLKVNHPEMLDSVATDNLDESMGSQQDDASTSGISEITDKASKRRKRSTKNPEHKKHKQKHVCKNKRNKNLPEVDVSEPDVQRQLMAMPSLLSQKYPPKMSIMTNTIKLNQPLIHSNIDIKDEFDDLQLDTPLSPSPPLLDNYLEQDNLTTAVKQEPAPSFVKQENTNEATVQCSEAGTSTMNTRIDSLATSPSSFIINKPIGTSLLGNPGAYLRKPIIKAPRFSVLKKSHSSYERKTPPPVTTESAENSITADTDVCNAIDGLMGLHEQSRATTLKDARFCSNRSSIFEPPLTCPSTNDIANSPISVKDPVSFKEASMRHWQKQFESSANPMRPPNHLQNPTFSIIRHSNNPTINNDIANPQISVKDPVSFKDTSIKHWPKSLDPSANPVRAPNHLQNQTFSIIRNSTTPTINKIWQNQTQVCNEKTSSDGVQTPISVYQNVQMIPAQLVSVLLKTDKNRCVAARPYTSGTKVDPESSVVPIPATGRTCNLEPNNKSDLSIPVFAPIPTRPLLQNALPGLKQTSETVGRQPRKRAPTKFIKAPLTENLSLNPNVNGGGGQEISQMCSIATQVDNRVDVSTLNCNVEKTSPSGEQRSEMYGCSSYEKTSNNSEEKNEPDIIQVDIKSSEPQFPLAPSGNYPSPGETHDPRTQTLNIISSSSTCSKLTIPKPKKPRVNKRKIKDRERKLSAMERHTLELEPPVLTVEQTSSTTHHPKSCSHEIVKIPTLNNYSPIPGHISELLFPNNPELDLLQAFNDYWSAQVSHCAVCAAFTSTSSGGSRQMPPDWKYCKPTVLPESSPIWVRSHLPYNWHGSLKTHQMFTNVPDFRNDAY